LATVSKSNIASNRHTATVSNFLISLLLDFRACFAKVLPDISKVRGTRKITNDPEERERLLTLKEAGKKLITQHAAAEEYLAVLVRHAGFGASSPPAVW
jgi:hypothetical protein